MADVHSLVAKYWDRVREHRMWLHRHPEGSGQEHETAAYIAKTLREMGLDPREGVGGCGVVALIEGKKGAGKCVGLRADFDALQIDECTGLDFSSEHPGFAHSCGHDAHTAMLLGAAYVLNELRGEFAGSVKLVFQPSEENAADSGAKKMIAEGVLEDPPVDAMFGQHVDPVYPVGTVATRAGAMTSASDRFFLTIRGKASHGSAPQDGVDAIVIAAQVISALQTIVARNVAPLESTVVTVGTITGGTRYNIIPEEVKLDGTVRNLDFAVRERVQGRMESIIKGVVEGLGGTYEFRYVKGHPPTMTDGAMMEIVRGAAEAAGAEFREMPHSWLAGEDFSYYSREVPSALFMLGCHDEKKPFYPLHNGAFAPEWEALPIGMETMVNAALRALA